MTQLLVILKIMQTFVLVNSETELKCGSLSMNHTLLHGLGKKELYQTFNFKKCFNSFFNVYKLSVN